MKFGTKDKFQELRRKVLNRFEVLIFITFLELLNKNKNVIDTRNKNKRTHTMEGFRAAMRN